MTASVSAPCTPSSSYTGRGGGGDDVTGGDDFDDIEALLRPSHRLNVRMGGGHVTAPVTRPSSTCTSSSSSSLFDGASKSENTARTSLSASASPYASLFRSLSPESVPTPLSDGPTHGVGTCGQAPGERNPELNTSASSDQSAISPALSQLPPTVLHELIASATSNLYIRGLPIHVTDSHLFALCSPHGQVLSAKSIVDLRTGQCKGYGFVLFARPHDAVAAMLFINQNPFVLGGPGLQASMARESFSAKLKVLQDDESANVYLSNLPPSMDEEGLRDLLQPVRALSVRILVGPTGVSRGVGFSRLANRDEAHQVIVKLNRLVLEPGLPPLQVRFADSPAQKMLKAVTCPPPPRKGPPGPARPCAGEMPPPRSHSYPAPPRNNRIRASGLPAPVRRDPVSKRVALETATVASTGSPTAMARTVVQTVMGKASSSTPRPRHVHGRHSSGSWAQDGQGRRVSDQERGRTMHRRSQFPHYQDKNAKQPANSADSTAATPMRPSVPSSTQIAHPEAQPNSANVAMSVFFVPFATPTPSFGSMPAYHDPSTGLPLTMPMPPLPMPLVSTHAPDAPPMYFVAAPNGNPSSTSGPNPSAPCTIAYAAIDQHGQPLMTWAMPCTPIGPSTVPARSTSPPADMSSLPTAPVQSMQHTATPLSPIPSPTLLSPPSLTPWSPAPAGLLSSPPAGPPVLTSASSMDDLMLPSMSTASATAEKMCPAGRGTPSFKERDQALDTVVKPRATSFSVSMLMNAGGSML